MKRIILRSDAPKIKVGSIICFTNKLNWRVTLIVFRVTDKSWFIRVNGHTFRKSYGSLIEYSKLTDFNIIY